MKRSFQKIFSAESKIEQWFTLHLGWLVTNGNKQQRYLDECALIKFQKTKKHDTK